MRLIQILNEQTNIMEGGNAFDDVGTIHIDEISPTLKAIERKTKLSDILARALGSVGKKEYSGDIDIAVEPKDAEQTAEFIQSLVAAYGEENVRQIGQLVTTSVPIINYNPKNDKRQPRTGRVQVDYMFGNPEWLKLYYHAPRHSESKLKGAHRNLAIGAISAFVDREESEERDDFNRPIEMIRWKWSPRDGLVKVKRTSRKNERTDKWVKQQNDTVLTKPITNGEEIASKLFNGKAGVEALNSAESLVQAVASAYDPSTTEEIYKQIARNYADYDANSKPDDFPEEIAKYL